MGNQGAKLYKLLEKTTVGDLIASKQPHPIKMITTDNTLEELISLLRENRYHSVPLYDENLKQDRGLVDCGDILAYLLHLEQTNQNASPEEIKELFLQTKVKAKLADFSHQNFCSSVSTKDNLVKLLRNLSGSDRLQRVIVRDENNVITKVIGQSLVLHFLYENCDLIRTTPFHNLSNVLSQAPKKISASDLQSTRTILSIPEDVRALDAFNFLAENKLRSAPILSPEGKILANLSITDIIAISSETWHLLGHPVKTFLEETGRFREPVTIPPTLKLKKVVCALHDNKIHRVYVVDENLKPIGVVSVSDILFYFKNLSNVSK